MSDNIISVSIPVNQWVDLYQESGVEVGTAVSIENVGSCDVYLAVQEDQPDPDHDAYNVVQRLNGLTLQNNKGDLGAWAYCNAQEGKVQVMPVAETGFYPNVGVMVKTFDGRKVDNHNPFPIKDIDANDRASLNTQFGEKIHGVRRADIAAQFQYGFPASAASPVVANGGSVTTVDAMLTVSTGVNPAGAASISNRKALRYLPGHEAYIYFTAVFSAGQANSYQRAGIFDDNNGFFLGFEGVDFKVTRRRDGVDFSYTITLADVFEPDFDTFDPTKGNVYRISFGYLGFAAINFEVLQPCGCWKMIYRIEYPNTALVTHIVNTNLQPRAQVANTGNTTDIVIKSGSFTAGVVNGGGMDPSARQFSFPLSDQSVIAGTVPVLTFRSKSTFAGLVNYISSIFTLLSYNTDFSRSSLWVLKLNPTITNVPTWTDVDTNDSTIEYSTDAVVTYASGKDIIDLPLGTNDRELLTDIEDQQIELLPGDHITLFIVSPVGTTGTYDLSFRWKELF